MSDPLDFSWLGGASGPPADPLDFSWLDRPDPLDFSWLPGNLRPAAPGLLSTIEATEQLGLPLPSRREGLSGQEAFRARNRQVAGAAALRFGTGLMEGAASPEMVASVAEKLPWWTPGIAGAKVGAKLLPDSYREGARERQGLAGEGRDLASRHLMEAGLGPLGATLAGEVGENADLALGGAAAGVKGVRGLARAVDFTDVAEGIGRGLGDTPAPIRRAPAIAETPVYRGKEMRLQEGRKTLVRQSDQGEDLGYIEIEPSGDGYRVGHVWVEPEHRGSGIPEELYREAWEQHGTYLGSTDYAGRRTPAGEKLAERLQQTIPEIFEGRPRTSGAAAEVASDPVRDTFLGKYAGEVTDHPPAESWLQRTWDRFYSEVVNKDAPIEELGDLAGRPELTHLVQRARGAAEISRGPLFRGPTRLDPTTGNVVRTGEPLRQIVRGLDGEGLKDLDALLMAERQLELSDRVAHSQAMARTADPALLKPGPPPSRQRRRMPREMVDPAASPPKRMTYKNRGLTEKSPLLKPQPASPSLLEQPARPITAALKDVDPLVTAEARGQIEHLRTKLGPRFDDLQMRAERLRDWSRKSTLDPLREVGLVSEEAYGRITAANQSYAPFMRIVDDVEGLLEGSGASFVKEITGGLSEAKKTSLPLEEMVLKVQRVQRWVEHQRVRNTLADVIDAEPGMALSKEFRRLDGFAKDAFPAYRNGEVTYYKAPKEALRALDRVSAGSGDASLLVKAASLPARTLRTFATHSLEFIARNPLRDQFTAGIVSRHGYVPFYDLAKGFFHASPPGRRLSALYDEYLDSGSSIASMASVDRPHVAATLRDLSGQGAGEAVKRFLHTWRQEGVLYPLQILSSAAEKGTRVGAFARARGKGASSLEAMSEAREITLDFGRAGHTGRVANQLYAFLNAEIQDIDKMVRAFKARPAGTSLKALSYVTLPSVANYMLWRGDQQYRDLPEWEKATYLHVGKREDGSFIRFPRAIGILPLVAGYGVEKFLEYADRRDPQALEEMAARFVADTPARFVADPQELIPTGLAPLAEVSAGPGGWDAWRDRPVVPRGLQGLDPAMQSTERTPQMLQDFGAATGTSPMKAEHLVRGYTAGLGVSTMELLDGYYREAKGLFGGESEDRPGLPLEANQLPLLKGFISRRPFGFSSAPVDELYKRAAAAEQSWSTYRTLRETSPRKALEYRAQHPEIERAKDLRKAKSQLSALRDRRDAILNLAHTTPEWRAEMLLKIDQSVTHYAHAQLQRMGYEGGEP